MLSDIARCIEQATTFKPNGLLGDIYGEYYSPYYAFFILAMGLSTKQQPKVAVELGVDKGRGLASLAYGGGNGSRVYGIDHTVKPGLQTVLDTFGNITFLQTNSNPPPGEIPDNIHLLHIDTEHSHAQAETEFEAYQPKLADRAIVVFDDLHAQENSVMDYFVSLPYPKIQDDRLHPVDGWGVVLYER